MEALTRGACTRRANCWKTASTAAAETALGTMAEEKAARVNDRLKHTERGKEEGGQEETVWVLSGINNCLMCTQMLIGLGTTALSCYVFRLKHPRECFHSTRC